MWSSLLCNLTVNEASVHDIGAIVFGVLITASLFFCAGRTVFSDLAILIEKLYISRSDHCCVLPWSLCTVFNARSYCPDGADTQEIVSFWQRSKLITF